MYQQILSLILFFILLPSCSITKNTKEQNIRNAILSKITSDISVTYKKDGSFVNYTCNTKITKQQITNNYKAVKQKCIKKITLLFENNQTREHMKSRILETLRTVSTNNDANDPKQIVTILLLNMITKLTTEFENDSIKGKSYSRNTPVSISFSY